MSTGTLHALCSNSFSPTEESVEVGPNLHVLSSSGVSNLVLELWSRAL